MVDYDIIQNSELRLLVMASESMNSLPEDRRQVMVGKIAALPEEGQQEFLVALRNERMQIDNARAQKGVTTLMEMEMIKKSSAELAASSRGFEMEVNAARESAVVQQEGPAENILQSI